MTLMLNTQNIIVITRFAIVAAIVILFVILKDIHIIQLNSYNLDQQIIWYKKNKSRFLFHIVLIISAIFYYKFEISIFLMLIIISILGILIENFPRRQKKKLVFTSRIKRLIFICVLLFVPFFFKAFFHQDVSNIFYLVLAIGISNFIVFLAFFISLPIENGFRKKFMLEAKKIIDDNSLLKVVGITGSFGKTSVKYYLDSLLKLKYNVCKTPESFNTAMGATLTIKNDLRAFDDIFICEMGARRVLDVKEICDIVSPMSCIITDVGNMHLDTFKTIENVRKCKFELVDAVCNSKSNDKVIFLNGDNDLIMEQKLKYEKDGRFSNVTVYTYGFDEICDFAISNVKVGTFGSTFTIQYKNTKFDIITKLLGKHNIKNLTAAIAFAYIFGVDIEDIVREVKTINAVEHRLQLIKLESDSLLIDDAYNSNPQGARASADVLSEFKEYIKIMITPGMVELGDKQYDENTLFAKYASDKVDYALIVGDTNREALHNGFANLGKDNCLVFDKVEEAFSYAKTNIKGKKVILLENDLSDVY